MILNKEKRKHKSQQYSLVTGKGSGIRKAIGSHHNVGALCSNIANLYSFRSFSPMVIYFFI